MKPRRFAATFYQFFIQHITNQALEKISCKSVLRSGNRYDFFTYKINHGMPNTCSCKNFLRVGIQEITSVRENGRFD